MKANKSKIIKTKKITNLKSKKLNLLKKKLHKESEIVRKVSMKVLKEFEAIED